MSRLAVDVGGTWLRYEVVGDDEVCARIPGEETGLAAFLESMLRRRPDIDAVAVSYAGQVHEGTILSAPNIKVDEADLRSWAEAKFGVALLLENDLNCAALAESVYWGEEHLAALYCGTGLGAGIVEKGAICRGFRNLAGEIGHVPYKKAPFRCGCGKDNCLELYASGGALRKWSDRLGCEAGALERALGGRGAEECRLFVENFVDALLRAAATLVTLCNPRVLVLGGGVLSKNPVLLQRVRTQIGAYALPASTEGLRIEISRIENAPLEGAKLLLDTI